MVLLPQENLERLQCTFTSGEQQQSQMLKSVQTPGSTTSRLDAEMNDILNSSTCKDEREKWSLYRQVLQRYLHFKNSDGTSIRELNDDKNEEPTPSEIKEKKKNKENLSDTSIVESVPFRYRSNATKLLRRLHDSNNITWDQNGAVKIDGVRIRNANIIDLVNDAMRERKTTATPHGHLQFARLIHESCVPREYIGNRRVLKNATRLLSESSSSEGAEGSPEQNAGNIPGANSDEVDSGEDGSSTPKPKQVKRKILATPKQLQRWQRLSGSVKKRLPDNKKI